MGLTWLSLETRTRVVYSGLLALAVYTGWRGWRATRDLQHRAGEWQSAYIDDFRLVHLAGVEITRDGEVDNVQTPALVLRSVEGSVQSRPVLGGLHHVYERAA